jgi:hypothetical protein
MTGRGEASVRVPRVLEVRFLRDGDGALVVVDLEEGRDPLVVATTARAKPARPPWGLLAAGSGLVAAVCAAGLALG